MHPFRKLREDEASTAADYETLLADNFVFHTPVLAYGVTDRKAAAAIFAAAPGVKKGAFVGEWRLDARKTLLHWKGEIQGHELESFEILTENEDGQLIDRTEAFRPMLAARIFRDTMYPRMKDKLPPDIREYPGAAKA